MIQKITNDLSQDRLKNNNIVNEQLAYFILIGWLNEGIRTIKTQIYDTFYFPQFAALKLYSIYITKSLNAITKRSNLL